MGDEVLGASLGDTVFSADLGGSRNYSNDNFEGRSGERPHVNSHWTWVSRSHQVSKVSSINVLGWEIAEPAHDEGVRQLVAGVLQPHVVGFEWLFYRS